MRLVWLALWGIAQTGLPTARTHRIEVASSPQGIEAEMPHAGAYARGIRADAELDFASARTHYQAAMEEFRRAGQNVWADKSNRQFLLSAQLEQASGARMGSSAFTASAYFRLPCALAYHEKFLSTRAFLGHPLPELAARAEALYRQILDGEPENVSARLDLAALYGELGLVGQAETEFRRVPDSRRNEDMHSIELARYYASRGMIDDAFQALDRARRRLSHEVRDLPLCNSFDRLRKDARFPRPAGSPFPLVTPPRPYGGWPLPPRQ